MKHIFLSIFLFGFFNQSAPEADIGYFRYQRLVFVTAPDRQNYVMVDSSIWQHARPDLEDIRLYDGQSQVPYVLQERRGGTSKIEQEAQILNLGSKNSATEFDVSVGDLPQYDQIRLRLDAKDFVSTAEIEGKNEFNESAGVKLPNSTLYDFSSEKLGSNFILKLPPSSFRYLHIRISKGIKPDQVKGAAVFDQQLEKASWSNTMQCQVTALRPNTKILCALDSVIPVSHIVFAIDKGTPNFHRKVYVADSKGNTIDYGEISRIHVVQGGNTVISENLAMDIAEIRDTKLTITVENGDDRPLPLSSAIIQSVERRIWFEPAGKTSLQMYYGDKPLGAPSYDYEKLFKEDHSAVEAKLGSEIANPTYTERPDGRPWSDRHKTILWAAMLLAVSVLTLLAVRGLMASSTSKQ